MNKETAEENICDNMRNKVYFVPWTINTQYTIIKKNWVKEFVRSVNQ